MLLLYHILCYWQDVQAFVHVLNFSNKVSLPGGCSAGTQNFPRRGKFCSGEIARSFLASTIPPTRSASRCLPVDRVGDIGKSQKIRARSRFPRPAPHPPGRETRTEPFIVRHATYHTGRHCETPKAFHMPLRGMARLTTGNQRIGVPCRFCARSPSKIF